jgi:hypothetical protein
MDARINGWVNERMDGGMNEEQQYIQNHVENIRI